MYSCTPIFYKKKRGIAVRGNEAVNLHGTVRFLSPVKSAGMEDVLLASCVLRAAFRR
jgi:hypothetical protein